MKKKILVAPLDWGLGHASRCIPIINSLIELGAEVVLAADGDPMLMLKKAFPDLRCIQLKGYPIRYPLRMPFGVYFAMRLPAMQRMIRWEHDQLKWLQQKEKFDAVISDNRYGLFLNSVPSVIITHQLQLMYTPLSGLLKRIIKARLSPFNAVWVPDIEGEHNLSGQLSHGIDAHAAIKFIGPLTHFIADPIPIREIKYDLLVLLSGPEPHRTILENKLIQQIMPLDDKVLLVSGQAEKELDTHHREHFRQLSFLSTEQLQRCILQSDTIIARSAYSSIMDLAFLKKKALLIPTTGQAEQMYLANYLKSKKWFFTSDEQSLNLKEQIQETREYRCPLAEDVFCQHKKVLEDWLKAI